MAMMDHEVDVLVAGADAATLHRELHGYVRKVCRTNYVAFEIESWLAEHDLYARSQCAAGRCSLSLRGRREPPYKMRAEVRRGAGT
jgi:hypothetical protein